MACTAGSYVVPTGAGIGAEPKDSVFDFIR
jgi:hypothetical protein